MSEFKFSCPNCNQNIAATSEYSGLQINCPSCQTLLVVPADPNAPAPAPTGSRLSMAASTPHAAAPVGAAAASAMYANANRPVKKKKSKTGLIVGLSLGACAVAAAIYFWPTLMDKLKHHDEKLAAAEAATNAPPPPPPPLTTEEILAKVDETYKGMTDYAAKAKTDCNIDMSALVPGKKISMTTASSLQLGRTNNYRLEWEQHASDKTTKGAAWSAGKGNYVGYGAYPPGKVKTRTEALLPAGSMFFLLSGEIAELFFADTNNLGAEAKDFTKTNGDNLNGHDCYVLTGEANYQSVLLWVDKNTFVIAQIQVALGGTVPEEELKKLPSAQRNLMATMSKLKGTITETYDSIQTNRNLLASAFESPYTPSANPEAQQRPARASSMAGQLTNPRRQRGGQ
jgi:hypothetical protein